MPICIVVEAEIKEDRMDDFLAMIEANAIGSRKEPGCIRFGERSGKTRRLPIARRVRSFFVGRFFPRP